MKLPGLGGRVYKAWSQSGRVSQLVTHKVQGWEEGGIGTSSSQNPGGDEQEDTGVVLQTPAPGTYHHHPETPENMKTRGWDHKKGRRR